MLNIEAAQQEIRTKTKAQIETETAWKWASRAIACFLEAGATSDPMEQARWLKQAEDYAHEALEHSSQVRDQAQTLLAVEGALQQIGGMS